MADRRILMVEDEMCLAMMLEDLLVDAGYQVVRTGRLDDALRLAEEVEVDAAILDINLHGEPVYPLAGVLQDKNVPFVFASAYGHPGVPEEFREYPMLPKPYPPSAVVPMVERLLASNPARTPSAPSEIRGHAR